MFCSAALGTALAGSMDAAPLAELSAAVTAGSAGAAAVEAVLAALGLENVIVGMPAGGAVAALVPPARACMSAMRLATTAGTFLPGNPAGAGGAALEAAPLLATPARCVFRPPDGS